MSILHKPILKLEIWHDYFLGPKAQTELPDDYDISAAIALIPTAECQKNLKNLRWLIRAQPYGLALLAHVNSDARTTGKLTPIVSINAETRLTFWLVVRDRNFANYTNLPLSAPRDQLYYFSNTFGNSSAVTGNNPELFLSQPLVPYTAKEKYVVGDMVSYQVSNKQVTLEAIAPLESADDSPNIVKPIGDSISNDPLSPDNTGDWISKAASQYVSKRDQHKQQGSFRTEVLARASPRDTLVLTDANSEETVAFTVPDSHPTGTPLSVQLNFTDYSAGYYQLSHIQNGISHHINDFILCDSMASRDAFALVELSLKPAAVPKDFQLLTGTTATQQLNPKTYRIRFKNRTTRWRYHQQRPTRSVPPAKLPDYFQRIDTNTFVGKYPFEHYQHANRRLTDENSHVLPSPSLAKPPTIALSDSDPKTITALFSDIYL